MRNECEGLTLWPWLHQESSHKCMNKEQKCPPIMAFLQHFIIYLHT